MAFKRPLLITSVKDLKLNVDNDGVQAFFKDLLDYLDKRPMGGLLIRQFDKDDGVGGLYSKELQTDCITLNANDAFYNEKTHFLTLTEDGVLTLIHEGSHFMHLCIDKGKFSSPCYKDCDAFDIVNNANLLDSLNPTTGRTNRYMLEFEAGYRAICAAIMYDTNLEYKVAGDNFRNLMFSSGHYPQEFDALSQLLSFDNLNYALYNTIHNVSLSICAKAAENHKFSDFEDIAKFELKLTPKQQLIIMMLTQTVTEYFNHKSGEDEED